MFKEIAAVVIVAAGAGAFAGPVMAAQSEQSKACSAQATAQGLHGEKRESFRAQCLKDQAPARNDGAAPGKVRVANTRMKTCAAEWKAAKAANQVPAGQRWPQYWSACNKRLSTS
jgi:hypothetical protein